MSADYVQPFVLGMKELMSTMLGATVSESGEPVSGLCPELTSIVELGGHAKGQFALSFPRDTARGMVAAMLGEQPELLDAETELNNAMNQQRSR